MRAGLAVLLLVASTACSGSSTESSSPLDPFALPAPPPSGVYDGPLFAMSADYPTASPSTTPPMPWRAAIGNGPITVANSNAYVMALKSEVAPDMKQLLFDYPNWDAAKAGWYNQPWESSIREPIHGILRGFHVLRGDVPGLQARWRHDHARLGVLRRGGRPEPGAGVGHHRHRPPVGHQLRRAAVPGRRSHRETGLHHGRRRHVAADGEGVPVGDLRQAGGRQHGLAGAPGGLAVPVRHHRQGLRRRPQDPVGVQHAGVRQGRSRRRLGQARPAGSHVGQRPVRDLSRGLQPDGSRRRSDGCAPRSPRRG